MTLRSPSGRRIDVTWTGEAEIAGVSASVRYLTNRASVGYQIGGPGYHETASLVVASAPLRRRVLWRGREVLVSAPDDGEVTIVTWRGPHHELMRLYHGPPPPLSHTLRELDMFTIHDEPEGCWLVPRPGSLCELVWEDLTVVVRGRGVVFVPDPRNARSMIPRGAGTPTRRGEIWRQSLDDDWWGNAGLRAYSYVVGGGQGAASVSIPDSVTTADDALLDWLDTLEITWS